MGDELFKESDYDATSGRHTRGTLQSSGTGSGGVKVCGVCGERASANNFGALTCDTCKAFFRRNALKEETSRCMFDNKCVIDRTTRKHCAACRLKKCFSIGMKPQLILDDSTKKARMMMRQKKRAEREQTSEQDQDDGEMTTCDHAAGTTGGIIVQQDVSSTTTTSHSATATSPSGAAGSITSTTIPQTDFPEAVPGQSSPDMATYPMGSATSAMPPPAVLPAPPTASSDPPSVSSDLFFQQALADMDLSSHDVPYGAPVAAVGLWAKPPCDGSSFYSLPQSGDTFQQRDVTGSGEGGSCYTSELSMTGTSQPRHSARHQGGVSFQHVQREDLPSDVKQYWRLSSEERATLTQVNCAYRDTMMKMTDRDPDKSKSLDPSKGELTMEDYFHVVEQILHLCVRFAKALPDFWQLKQPDQIAVLKASSMKCDGIALSAMSVPERNVWQTPFGDIGMNHIPSAMNLAIDCELLTEMLSFSRELKHIAKTDMTIYGLLHCVVLFEPSDSAVEDKQLVNSLKDKYLILLKHYLESEFSYLHADRYLEVLMEKLRKLQSMSQDSFSYLRQFSAFFKPLGVEFFSQD